MKKQFYDHLVSFETLEIELAHTNASEEEKKHLKSLAEENIHYAIIDLILSELSSEDKKTFLKHFHTENHEKVWEFLRGKTSNLEKKISQTASTILEELRKDILEVN